MTSSQKVSKRRKKVKSLIVEYMGGKCLRCGWCEHQSGLIPHHVNPQKKEFALGSNGITRSFEKAKAEARKCILLCANCHAVIHSINDNFYFDEKNIPNYPDLIEIHNKKVNNCKICGDVISNNSLHCFKCSAKLKEKIDWPSVETLLKMLENSNYTQVAKQLGVSDNAIRKRLKSHNVE